jgi:hypothetical protein
VPKFGLPEAVGYPINTFAILFIFENDNKTVCEWLLLRLSAIQTFVQNKQMGFDIANAFFVGFNDVVLHGFGFNVMCSATLRTHNFQKKKREKRKPSVEVEGFKKASFSDKILPDMRLDEAI